MTASCRAAIGSCSRCARRRRRRLRPGRAVAGSRPPPHRRGTLPVRQGPRRRDAGTPGGAVVGTAQRAAGGHRHRAPLPRQAQARARSRSAARSAPAAASPVSLRLGKAGRVDRRGRRAGGEPRRARRSRERSCRRVRPRPGQAAPGGRRVRLLQRRLAGMRLLARTPRARYDAPHARARPGLPQGQRDAAHLRRSTRRSSLRVARGAGRFVAALPEPRPPRRGRPLAPGLALIDAAARSIGPTRPARASRRRRRPRPLPLLPASTRARTPRDGQLQLLHRRLRDPRLHRGADLPGQPRLPAHADDRTRCHDHTTGSGSATGSTSTARAPMDVADARRSSIAELREHALVIGEVDADQRRDGAVLRRRQAGDPAPAGFRALGELVAERRARVRRDRRRRHDDGRRPVACAALAGGADVKAFFVRKEAKAHGLQRRIEGPLLDAGRPLPGRRGRRARPAARRSRRSRRVQRGRATRSSASSRSSTAWPAAARAIEAAAGAPYRALTTIDDVYPERPDRERACTRADDSRRVRRRRAEPALRASSRRLPHRGPGQPADRGIGRRARRPHATRPAQSAWPCVRSPAWTYFGPQRRRARSVADHRRDHVGVALARHAGARG